MTEIVFGFLVISGIKKVFPIVIRILLFILDYLLHLEWGQVEEEEQPIHLPAFLFLYIYFIIKITVTDKMSIIIILEIFSLMKFSILSPHFRCLVIIRLLVVSTLGSRQGFPVALDLRGIYLCVINSAEL
jgi:hypothetical protein